VLGVVGPGVGGVDVEIEELGEDGGGEFGGQSSEGGAAGAAEVDGQVCAQLAVDGVAGGSSGQAAGEQPTGAVVGGAGEHGCTGAVLTLGVEQDGDRVREQQSVLSHLQPAGSGRLAWGRSELSNVCPLGKQVRLRELFLNRFMLFQLEQIWSTGARVTVGGGSER
jgi:hypothetical protein